MQRHAKQLRSSQTDAESAIWFRLRAHRFLGLKFKRQKPVGRYIVDFICSEVGLVVELDGGQHNASQRERDQRRDGWMRQQGLTVLRFWNDDVLRDIDAVLEVIRLAAFADRPSPPTPLPLAGEGSRSQP
ncbi:endonuclease domain-containing protein [Hydrocarboniphaga sp.]|uniref:endonuclease domain-containing protein n=1 Tax=Hydrocarboniphaga sp. TaxID=2033016 RepID=UPI003D095FA2